MQSLINETNLSRSYNTLSRVQGHLHEDHTRAIEYEDVNIVLRTEERRRERERARDIYLSTPWETIPNTSRALGLSNCFQVEGVRSSSTM
jgi:hypothetical protein